MVINRANDWMFFENSIFSEKMIVLGARAASRVFLAAGEFPRSEPSNHPSCVAYRALAWPQLSESSIDCNKTPGLSLIGALDVNSGTVGRCRTCWGAEIGK
jgi:hypothetical protein